MVNYVLSFCKITGASKIFTRHFYLPLLKPLTPKDALRTLRITGKWLLGAKIQHYIPVLHNHKKKKSKKSKNFGQKPLEEKNDFPYMTPVLDSENENHKLLLDILEGKKASGMFVYTVEDKKYNIVLQANIERAILDGDVIDVLVSQKNDKIIIKLQNMKKIPLEIQNYEGKDKLYCGEGATSPEEEQFHHHGKYTMSLAKIFEDKELDEERWEEELRKIMKRRRKQAREGSREWKEMFKESIKNLDWKKFEEDAKKVIEEIEEPATEQEIDMEIDDLETTKNVNEVIMKHGSDLLDKLPTMKEIPDIIKSMGNATLHEIEDDEPSEEATKKRRVSGVKVTLSSGKECFVSGQMVHTEDGDVFVPGQTIENEYGLEYAPGITINIDNKPTLINGLIMGEEETKPMFLPTESTITADGQLTFATAPEERPQPQPEKLKKRKQKFEIIEEVSENDPIAEKEPEPEPEPEVESDSAEMEDLDPEAIRLKQEQERLELEKLKMILFDDGLDDILESIEKKRAKLKQKLEEMRRLSISNENTLVTYVVESDTIEIASKISDDKETINRLSDILMTMTRRAATFRDKNSVYADNINQACISVSNTTEADVKFNKSPNKLKMLLKTALVAANDVFKNRPKDQVLALNAIGDIIADVLKTDQKTLQDLLDLMKTPVERNEICYAIFKQLTQNIMETKVSILGTIVNRNLATDDVVDTLEKMLRKQGDTKCEAFIKIAKVDGQIVESFIKRLKDKIKKVETEEEATELLNTAIESAIEIFKSDKLKQLLATGDDLSELENEALSFAKALNQVRAEKILGEATHLSLITDRTTVELLERVILIRHLSEKDSSLRSAIDRLKKNPERGRSDPRIRQLIRETALLTPQINSVRNSKDIPIQLLKSQNLLAIEDCLIQRSQLEYPVLITRDNLQAVIPKEATRGVLAGRVPYALIDESGITNFKPFGVNRDKRIDDYLNSGIRDRSSDRDGNNNRKFLQAQNNVRKLKNMYSNDNNCRQLA